ncbi:MotA/TolQ/ExbB proton channel family protein [Paraglaciecola sp.]|uniref:MotA/TolQ/ExbB proton channel family protein n=1 Tax=Paraglaciecola sp. TaxID=1920173 RepID=UPI0030F3BFA6
MLFSRQQLKLMVHIFAIVAASVAYQTAMANDKLDSALLKKITQAELQLSITEKRISGEKSQLAQQLNQLEQQVQALQQKTAAARRLSDEKTLSLGHLEGRIKEWREQQAYQQNLLNRFLHQQQLATQVSVVPVEQKFELLLQFASQLQTKLQLVWQQQDVVMANGKIESLPTLSVGPLHWYWLDSAQQAGIAKRHNGQLQSELLLSSGASSGLADIKQTGHGTLMFDPTMNRAMARQQHSESAWQHLVKGGLWVVPILLFAALAVIIALYKSWQLIRLPKLVSFTPNHLHRLLHGSDTTTLNTVKGPQHQLLKIAMEAPNEKRRDDQLFIQLQHDKHWLERWLMAIGITASVAPLLGLLGTVSGMIETFKMMTLFGSGDPEVVSGGIAQALITTELGLVVAIPALVLNAILSKRAKSYYFELGNFAILLSQPRELNDNEAQKVAA